MTRDNISDEDLASISENCSPVWKAIARELIAARVALAASKSDRRWRLEETHEQWQARIATVATEEREAVVRIVCEAFRQQGVTSPENHPIIAAIRARGPASPDTNSPTEKKSGADTRT